MMRVPLVDLSAESRELGDELREALARVFERGDFILGQEVRELEERISSYIGAAFGVGVASGTDALLLSLMALGVGPGDRVITTPYTFFATASMASLLGAKPLFADIEPGSFNLNPARVEELLESRCKRGPAGELIFEEDRSRIKALIPVHLFGQCAPMEPLLGLAREYGVPIIEDAAQALGAGQEVHGVFRRAGSMGAFGCFSFYPTKCLGAAGDGGMVVTSDPELAESVRRLRVHGAQPKYRHRTLGINSRLATLQAALLLVKLSHLEGWCERRRALAGEYGRLFAEAGLLGRVELPAVEPGNTHIFSQYVIRAERRDELRAHLEASGISTEIYYPIPLHLQECYSSLGHRSGDFPEAERAAGSSLALPLYPSLSSRQQEYVVERIGEFYRKVGRGI
ncbi:MAG: DegT/DnrJ/EryC1/StrS family aminotransferase [Nitrospinota bacterium]